jgi:hypothetical protein
VHLPEQSVADILYAQFGPGDRLTRFVRLTQRAAQPGEALPDGEKITINGQPTVLSFVSGEFVPPEHLYQQPVAYTGAVQITWIVDATWIQILANISKEEALHVVESMVPAE